MNLRIPLLVTLLVGLMMPGYGQGPDVGIQPTAEKELLQWAERGDADAQFELGLRYLTGEGVEKDLTKGVDWLRKAAEEGHLRAQHIFGSIYEEGTGVEKDPVKAAEWFEKAASGGLSMAQHSIAVAYELGTGVEKDPAKAFEWFRKAALQNYPPSMAAYASKLERGDGTEKDAPRAALFYLKASKLDYVPAMSRMAYLYYTGVGVPVDYRRSFGWYQRAARSGSPWAANDLAWFLSTSPDESLHNGEQSVVIAKEALKMQAEGGAEQRYEMIDTMAAALARNGEFKEAVLWQKKALELLEEDEDIEDEPRKDLQKEFEDRLKLYERETPYTEKEAESESDAQPLPQDSILKDEGIPEAPPKPRKGRGKSGRGTVV